MNKYAKYILVFIVVVQTIGLFTACSEKFRPMIIEKPPVRIAVGGKLDKDQERVLYNVMQMTFATKYENYLPPFKLGVESSDTVNHSHHEEYNFSETLGGGK